MTLVSARSSPHSPPLPPIGNGDNRRHLTLGDRIFPLCNTRQKQQRGIEKSAGFGTTKQTDPLHFFTLCISREPGDETATPVASRALCAVSQEWMRCPTFRSRSVSVLETRDDCFGPWFSFLLQCMRIALEQASQPPRNRPSTEMIPDSARNHSNHRDQRR